MDCLYFSLLVTKDSNIEYVRMLKKALSDLNKYYKKEHGYDVLVFTNIDIKFPEYKFVKVIKTDYTDRYEVCDYYQTYDKENFNIAQYLNRNLHSSWMHKWYSLENAIKLGYDRILFSDCDVIINDNLTGIFSLYNNELENQNNFYFSESYDENIDRYFKFNFSANSGHFLLRPTKINEANIYEKIVEKRRGMDIIMASFFEKEHLSIETLEHFGFFNEQYCAQMYFEELGYNIERFPNFTIGRTGQSASPENFLIFHYHYNYKNKYLN
jgi:hypothetical protein